MYFSIGKMLHQLHSGIGVMCIACTNQMWELSLFDGSLLKCREGPKIEHYNLILELQ